MLERLDSEEATFRVHLTGQLLRCKVIPVAQVKARLNGEARQKHPVHSRQLDAAGKHPAGRQLCGLVLVPRCSINMTSPRSNSTSLRILQGTGMEGLPTLDIAERMIEQAPGITRLLDRLERKKLVRRERPPDNRRQDLCYITKPGLDLLQELDTPFSEPG